MYTNYTLRIPVQDVVGQDVDFWMKKPCTMDELRNAFKQCLKERLDIKGVPVAELDHMLINWGVWDELKVLISTDEDGVQKEAHFGSVIDNHIDIFEAMATALVNNDESFVPTKAGRIMFQPLEMSRLGSLKARMGIGDITAE